MEVWLKEEGKGGPGLEELLMSQVEVMGFVDEVVTHSDADQPFIMRILNSRWTVKIRCTGDHINASSSREGGERKTRRYELKETLYCSAHNMRWRTRPPRPVAGVHDTAHGSP